MRDNTLIKYLKLAERIDASDIHIKSGKCAIARVAGTLKQIDDTVLTKEQVFSFIQDILTEKQMTEFDLYSDVDSSFSVGDRRFRCNVYRDFNGFSISIRRIINEIGDFRSLGIPEVLKNLAVKKAGLSLLRDLRAAVKRQRSQASSIISTASLRRTSSQSKTLSNILIRPTVA